MLLGAEPCITECLEVPSSSPSRHFAASFENHCPIVLVGSGSAASETPDTKPSGPTPDLQKRFCHLGTNLVFQVVLMEIWELIQTHLRPCGMKATVLFPYASKVPLHPSAHPLPWSTSFDAAWLTYNLPSHLEKLLFSSIGKSRVFHVTLLAGDSRRFCVPLKKTYLLWKRKTRKDLCPQHSTPRLKIPTNARILSVPSLSSVSGRDLGWQAVDLGH